jgi:hypothetical protein
VPLTVAPFPIRFLLRRDSGDDLATVLGVVTGALSRARMACTSCADPVTSSGRRRTGRSGPRCDDGQCGSRSAFAPPSGRASASA